MQLVGNLDRLHNGLDNEAMYKRAGKRVKQWRKDREMNQVTFARGAGISVGSLQTFEQAKRKTRTITIMKIAAAIGCSLDDLLHEDDPAPQPDPRARDLKDDDFLMAGRYHHASADVKYAVKRFLRPDLADEIRERVAVLLAHLLQLDADTLATIDSFVMELERDDTPETDQPVHKKPKKKSS